MALAVQSTSARAAMPKTGRNPEELLHELETLKANDVDYKHGRVAGLVYLVPDDVYQIGKEAYNRYFTENALSPKAFPSIGQLEQAVIQIAGNMMHGATVAGSMTSGGSESIMMGVKSAWSRAKAIHPHITAPELVCPFTAHAAFNKTAHYLGIKVNRVPFRDDYRVDARDIRAAVNDNTILIVGSAPSYPFGMVDPIPEMAAIAAERNINFHVDACVGGFHLPWLEKLGRTFPIWDFRVPGVCTISADLHKFGFTPKAASVILSRDEDIFQYQSYSFGDWPSGVYKTPNVTGSRPAGPIAAAWAVLNYLGEAGYTELARKTIAFCEKLWTGINATPGLRVRGTPDMCCFTYEAADPDLDIYALADGLERKGWFVYRERQPKGIHLMLSPGHEPYIDQYLSDIREVWAEVRANKTAAATTEARYG